MPVNISQDELIVLGYLYFSNFFKGKDSVTYSQINKDINNVNKIIDVDAVCRGLEGKGILFHTFIREDKSSWRAYGIKEEHFPSVFKHIEKERPNLAEFFFYSDT